MKLYKLTDENGQSRGGMQWGENTINYAEPGEPRLCSRTVLHAYTDPRLAALMAPAHVSWSRMRLWEAEGDVAVSDGTKVGCKTLTTVREMPLPEVTTEQRVTFAILCALEVCSDPSFVEWAHGWLSGADRSARAAYAADATAADAAADAAVAYAAADAARAAAYAAAAARAAANGDEIPRHAAKLACGILEMG